MKKIALVFIGVLAAAAIYYFTIGSGQIVKELKTQVNTQLTVLTKKGFTIEERKIEENKEHFVISFDDTQKISSFLYQQGIQITAEDALMLKGLKIAVNTLYLPDAYSSVAFDMYPISLPESLRSTSSEDKKVITEIKKLLEKKTFLMHIAVNKAFNGFKGHIEDINETITNNVAVNLQLKGLNFKGDIKDNTIHSIKQTLEHFAILISNEMKVVFSNIKSNYKVTGKTLYDYKTHYSVGDILLDIKSGLNIKLAEIDVLSSSTVVNNLASGTIKTTINHTHISDEKEPYDLENFAFEIKASNVDITAMNTLQKADLSNEKVMNSMLTQFFSKGVHFEIPTFSLENIETDGQSIEGFDLTAKVLLDKDFDIVALENNPLSALETVNADLNLVFSNELFELMSQQPQAMMALMMFQPQNKNNKKVYKLELKDGELFVNGAPVM